MVLKVDAFLRFVLAPELDKSIVLGNVTLSDKAMQVWRKVRNEKAILAVWYFTDCGLPVVYRLREVTPENFKEFLKD